MISRSGWLCASQWACVLLLLGCVHDYNIFHLWLIKFITCLALWTWGLSCPVRGSYREKAPTAFIHSFLMNESNTSISLEDGKEVVLITREASIEQPTTGCPLLCSVHLTLFVKPHFRSGPSILFGTLHLLLDISSYLGILKRTISYSEQSFM